MGKAVNAGRWLRVDGSRIVADSGENVTLRGVGVGGWLNMENFITGYPATESLQRAALRRSLGPAGYDAFFQTFLRCFFDVPDARYLASLGLNSVRLPVNYRHLTDSSAPGPAPLRLKEDGIEMIERAVAICAAEGLYTIIDLHALPGGQNANWHSDNPVHRAAFWEHQVFQDMAVALWEALADRFRDNPWVAGYNPVNEPASGDSGQVAAFYARLAEAIRQADPRHILFLDGDRYATDFSAFTEPIPNAVYAVHDYALPGIADTGVYPGHTRGQWFDRDAVEKKFLERTAFMRRTGTPIWVGEFGVIRTGDAARDESRYALLGDQLEIYRRHGAGWALWTYKDIGMQGLATARPGSPYMRRVAPVIEKKRRLGTDSWGGTDRHIRHIMEPIEDLFAEEFPGFDPYPWGAQPWIARLVRHILLAEPLVEDFARCFAGAGPAEAAELAGSFALDNCDRSDRLAGLLRHYAQ
jgi:endoglucanase